MNTRTRAIITRVLRLAGLSGRDAREIRGWSQTRGRAARTHQSIVTGSGIAMTGSGRVELVPVEVPLAGPGDVTIEVHRSAVSVGTEKARYLELPHARSDYPFRPGYTGAGVVIAVGAGVDHVVAGDIVAASGLLHQSVQTVSGRFVHRVDPRVDLDAAALLELGIIAAHGVEQAGLQRPSDFVVIGTGAIGALANRLLVARGHGPGAVVAATRTKQFVALAGQDFWTLADSDALDALAVPVVVESTSDVTSIANAIRFARSGGRVVLLGSPRGTELLVPVDHLQETGKQVVGAHISLVADDDRRRLGDEFLARLADGTLTTADLVTDRIDPGGAATFYRARISDPSVIAAVFDWTLLPDVDRCRPAARVSFPQVRTCGVTFDEQPAPRGSLGWASHRLVPPAPPRRATGSIGFGVVGCGEIAIQNAGAIGAATNATVVRTFDPDRRLAADLVRSFGGSPADTLGDLLADDEVDAIVLCVPHHLHAPLAIEAFAAGKHVVIEKPLANSIDAAVSIARAAESWGRTGSVCFPHRFDLRVRAATDLVRAGALGEVTGFSLTFFQDKPPSYWIGGYSGRSISDWRTSRERAGGGVLIMNACHYLDLLVHVTNLEITEVTAAMTFEGGREVEDGAFLTAAASNGAAGSITVSSSVSGARYDELRIWGTHGHVEVFPTPRAYTLRPMAGLTASRWQDLGAPGPGAYRQAYFEQLATALDEGGEPEVTIADGITVQTLISAAEKSARSGQRVDPRSLVRDVG